MPKTVTQNQGDPPLYIPLTNMTLVSSPALEIPPLPTWLYFTNDKVTDMCSGCV